MSQGNFFGICHPDDGGSRFVGNVTHLPDSIISHKMFSIKAWLHKKLETR
jgi:hypothetical protein